MTPVEWTQIKDDIADLWGKTPKWATYGNVARQAAPCDYNTAVAYVNSQLGAKFPPSPGDVIKASRPQTGDIIARPGVDECERDKGHKWGIIDEHADKSRLGLCVKCLVEQRFLAGRLCTMSELDDRRLKAQVRSPM